jgi:hypothetical protein
MDARRRWIDPWGAAQLEAREQEAQRRRDAFKKKIEREREAFRSQIPWEPQPSPWADETTVPSPEPAPPSEADAEVRHGQAGPTSSPYPLPGWDNRWYYRGY